MRVLALYWIIMSMFLATALHAAAAERPTADQIKQAVADGDLPGLHSVLVLLDSAPFTEVYLKGEDQRWGRDLGAVQHGPETLHDLRSVSKSIVGLLYGIALEQGLVPGLDASLLAQFPEYPDLAQDSQRAAITIRDVFTMQMGTQWDESLPYTDPRNSEIAMEMAKDRYRFVLDRPMVKKPGLEWSYNGGATALLGRLIAKGAGKPLDTFAKESLFDPLGIQFEWVKGADGEPSAASGLRLTAPGLAKIGQLINDDGVYAGRQLIPASWLEASFAPEATLPSGMRYGLHWYLAAQGDPPQWLSGFGNGGQRLTVQPQHNLVMVFFAGNYNQPDAWKIPARAVEEYLAPTLRKAIRGE